MQLTRRFYSTTRHTRHAHTHERHTHKPPTRSEHDLPRELLLRTRHSPNGGECEQLQQATCRHSARLAHSWPHEPAIRRREGVRPQVVAKLLASPLLTDCVVAHLNSLSRLIPTQPYMSAPLNPKPPPGRPKEAGPEVLSYRRALYERDAMLPNEPWNPAARLAQVRPSGQRTHTQHPPPAASRSPHLLSVNS